MNLFLSPVLSLTFCLSPQFMVSPQFVVFPLRLSKALDDLLYRTHKTDNTNKLSPTIDEEDPNIPTIFIITPTHKRWTQKADLTRFCQTLMHVKNIKWIVVEDRESKSSLVSNFLKYCKVSSVHLLQKSSSNFTNTIVPKKDDPSKYYLIQKPRGIEQRNMGLQWLREHYNVGKINGVVYFADDDNTYDLRIFEEVSQFYMHMYWYVHVYITSDICVHNDCIHLLIKYVTMYM